MMKETLSIYEQQAYSYLMRQQKDGCVTIKSYAAGGRDAWPDERKGSKSTTLLLRFRRALDDLVERGLIIITRHYNLGSITIRLIGTAEELILEEQLLKHIQKKTDGKVNSLGFAELATEIGKPETTPTQLEKVLRNLKSKGFLQYTATPDSSGALCTTLRQQKKLSKYTTAVYDYLMEQASIENPFKMKTYKEAAKNIWGGPESNAAIVRVQRGMQTLHKQGYIRYHGAKFRVAVEIFEPPPNQEPILKQDEPPEDKNTPTQATNDEWSVPHQLPPLKIDEANAQSEELPSLSTIMKRPIAVSSVSRPPAFTSQSIPPTPLPSVGELLATNGLYKPRPKKRVARSEGSSKRRKFSELVESGAEPQTELPAPPVHGSSAEDSEPCKNFYLLPAPLP